MTHRHHHHHHHHVHADGESHVHVDVHTSSVSHDHDAAGGEDAAFLEEAFIEGFRHAGDKAGFLRLARVPHELADGLKLVEVRIADAFEVGTATPGFGTAELVYHPFPAAMVRRTTRLSFVYRTLRETRELGWSQVMAASS